jgi:hypothetical protein
MTKEKVAPELGNGKWDEPGIFYLPATSRNERQVSFLFILVVFPIVLFF